MILVPISAALAAVPQCTVIHGATAHLPAGPSPVTLVVLERRVEAVGTQLAELVIRGDEATWKGAACALVRAPEGARLTAGLIAAPTQLGVVEVGLEEGSRSDDPRLSDDPIRASMRVVDGYQPLSTLIPVARLQGVTAALTVPSGGTVAGFGGFVKLSGGSQAEAVVDDTAVMVARVPTGAWGEGLLELSELLADTRAHLRDPSLFDRGRPYAHGAGRMDLEALGAVVRREVPLLLGANAAWQLEALARWKQQQGVDLVVVGAAEGWRVAEQLAAAKVPVMVDPLVYGPGSFEQVSARPDNPALLAAAGVDVIIAADGGHNARTLRILAGNAVRGGMDPEAALEAITEVPARVFGQPDRGVLRPGAIADLVLWSGDPLEISTRVVAEWIDGRPVELRSRQTELFEKYRTLPGTPAPPLSPR